MVSAELKARFERLLSSEAYRAAWRYALRLSANREDAEDLLQEALLKALCKLNSLRDEQRFKSWLLAILRRQFLDRRRTEHARPFTVELPRQLEPAPRDPLTEQLQLVLQTLPELQRELVSLYYIDGLSLEEAGEVLGLSMPAARQRLFRARRTMRKQLEIPPAPTATINSDWCQVRGECHE